MKQKKWFFCIVGLILLTLQLSISEIAYASEAENIEVNEKMDTTYVVGKDKYSLRIYGDFKKEIDFKIKGFLEKQGGFHIETNQNDALYADSKGTSFLLVRSLGEVQTRRKIRSMIDYKENYITDAEFKTYFKGYYREDGLNGEVASFFKHENQNYLFLEVNFDNGEKGISVFLPGEKDESVDELLFIVDQSEMNRHKAAIKAMVSSVRKGTQQNKRIPYQEFVAKEATNQSSEIADAGNEKNEKEQESTELEFTPRTKENAKMYVVLVVFLVLIGGLTFFSYTKK